MKKFISIIFLIIISVSCSKVTQPVDPIPKHDEFKFESKVLNEIRVINVWIPDDYANSSSLYPVMYMLDGGIKEDFPHIANTLEKLIKEKKIQPIILVGIENTERRRDLTGSTSVEKDKEIAPVVGGSEKFRNFIQLELIPNIDQKYRTNNDRSLIGESLSGLFVMETMLLTPNIFDRYIAFDPSFWWNDSYLMKNSKDFLNNITTQPKVLWFAGSGATDISKYTKQLAKNLSESKHSNINWKYEDEPNEKHNTIFRATKEKAIIWTLNQ